jgi:hypothetical protein
LCPGDAAQEQHPRNKSRKCGCRDPVRHKASPCSPSQASGGLWLTSANPPESIALPRYIEPMRSVPDEA